MGVKRSIEFDLGVFELDRELLAGGTVVGKEGKCVGPKGHGQYIKRGPSGDFLNTNFHKE